jgi:hypothetical protein
VVRCGSKVVRRAAGADLQESAFCHHAGNIVRCGPNIVRHGSRRFRQFSRAE